jgi:flavin reductase (DIM6/NTAB) family NADH-FMN oxidoreductase RutF
MFFDALAEGYCFVERLSMKAGRREKMSATTPTNVDPKVFREVMGHYPTGVAVVTGRAQNGEILALVVGTFSSVSLDPPIVSFMPMKSSRTFERLRTCDSLCINILGGEQQAEMLAIAQRRENKLDGIDWYPSPSGDPILRNSIAWIDTTIGEIVEAGDHWIALCDVKDLQVTNAVAPLLFFQGGYGSFAGEEQTSRLSHEILPAINAAHDSADSLKALAKSIGCEVAVFAAISDDEMATVFSELAADATEERRFASRFPLVPPIGDSYFFDKSPELQERWLNKLKNASEEVTERHRRRMEFMQEHGYLLAFLPEENSSAYEQMIRASEEYKKAKLTPAEERSIRETIGSTPVDYEPQEVLDSKVYHVGSIVLPVKDPSGRYTMTLRLAQLPSSATGAKVQVWIGEAKAVIEQIEQSKESN